MYCRLLSTQEHLSKRAAQLKYLSELHAHMQTRYQRITNLTASQLAGSRVLVSSVGAMGNRRLVADTSQTLLCLHYAQQAGPELEDGSGRVLCWLCEKGKPAPSNFVACSQLL